MITNPVSLKFSEQHNILAPGIKMLELCKLSWRAGKCKKEDEALVSYIQRSINEGDTVLDVGSKESNYMYFMRRKLKQSGKIIAFESQPYLYQNLLYLKKIMNWKNVEAEFVKLSNTPGMAVFHNRRRTASPNEALVININENLNNYVTGNIQVQTLDGYCVSQHIRPGFLKIDADGEELEILKGALDTLTIYKPKILVKCEERVAGAEKVMETFSLLNQLDYTGYFVLDTLRIPLVNFDFNVYQNPCRDFYCSNFMSE